MVSGTYTAGQGSALFRIRSAIGDTGAVSAFWLDDLDITAVNSGAASEVRAAAICARQVLNQMAFKVTEGSGRTSKQWSDMMARYEDNVVRKLEAAGDGTLPLNGSAPALLMYGGGQSRSDRDALYSDTDRPRPRVSQGQDDYPGTGGRVAPGPGSEWD